MWKNQLQSSGPPEGTQLPPIRRGDPQVLLKASCPRPTFNEIQDVASNPAPTP